MLRFFSLDFYFSFSLAGANDGSLLTLIFKGPDAVNYIVNHASIQFIFIFCVPQTLNIKSSGHASNGNPLSNGTPQPSSTPILSSISSKGVKKTHSFVGAVTSVTDGLKRLYTEKLNPLEDTYRFSDFGFPLLMSSDFDSKPMVMLLGQYSTGKTTFIKHLLGCAYLGAHIGPEPTTDRFIVVMSGPDERSIPGNTIAVQADMPFGGLTTFGGSFLSKFECSQMPHPLLDNITFVDTHGVLSGEKQRTQRSYDSVFSLPLLGVARLTISEESFEAEARDYTKLIHAYAKKKNLQEAEKILLEMKQKGYVCDQVTLTTLVHMYSKVGNLKLAECAFEEMKLLGEPLDRRAYGSMFLNRVFLKQFAPDTACCWSEFSMACAYSDDSLLPNWKGHS